MAKKKKPLPKGFTCECGVFNEFSLWVYAHWSIEVQFKCECDREYLIFQGEAERQ